MVVVKPTLMVYVQNAHLNISYTMIYVSHILKDVYNIQVKIVPNAEITMSSKMDNASIGNLQVWLF